LDKKGKLKFIDLFCGLGGFHLALTKLGHTCVFASDIDSALRNVYMKNFGITPKSDIRIVSLNEIPKHQILCAGFPCQSFSKAGLQKGLHDKDRGGLFYEIIRIIKHHKPKYLIMENVPNIKSHNNGKTWKKIEKELTKSGYTIATTELSPHHFGIPQIRLRTYIVGKRGKLDKFVWPKPKYDKNQLSVNSILDTNPKKARTLNLRTKQNISLWQEFLKIIPPKETIPHPLWAMEFGATYPYKTTTPYKCSINELKSYKGAFGAPLKGNTRKDLYLRLPSHATRQDLKFPKWKIRMIKRNRMFYMKNKGLLKAWIIKIKQFPPSFQKLEWNVGDGTRNINNYIIQCRPSGVRVKRLTTSPSLVAMNNTQIPIIPWENRYMTLKECSRLQSMGSLKYLPNCSSHAYRALGNAVNVKVVKLIADSLINGGKHLGK